MAAALAALACGGGNLVLPGDAAPPSDLLMVSGDGQTATAGAELPESLVVRLVDDQGNAVAAATVTWAVESGGGTVAPITGATDAEGLVSARWTLGPSPGPNSVSAVAPAVDVVTFSANATGGGGGPRLGPDHLRFQVQPSDAEADEPITPPVVVAVVDRNGEPVRDFKIRVELELSAGSGKLSGKLEGDTKDGVVVFDDLEVDEAGEGKVLRARAPEDGYLGTVDSESFDVRED
jgi:hypothetical protein